MKNPARFIGILLLLSLTVSAANSAADCYIYGRVAYKDGSACRNCCSVQAELSVSLRQPYIDARKFTHFSF